MTLVQNAVPITVLIVEDEEETSRRLSDAMSADPQLQLVGAVSCGRAAIEFLDARAPHVMLVDLGLPDMSGIEVIRYAAMRCPQTDCIVVTLFGDERSVLGSIDAGAVGYILKDAALSDISTLVREVRSGASPISPGIARLILRRARGGQPARSHQALGPAVSLTEREQDVLRMVAKGLSFVEVADALEISAHTVVTHVKKIYRKLAVKSRGEAVFEAMQSGLL